MILVPRISLLITLIPCSILLASAQSNPAANAPRAAAPATNVTCDEAPREDALIFLCAPPSFPEADAPVPASVFVAKIALDLPSGTALRIALDRRTRIDHPGEIVHGRVVDAVYVFDQPVIPAGSTVSGRVTNIMPVPGVKRTL